MPDRKGPYEQAGGRAPGDQSKELAALAHKAVDAFREENTEAYRELVEAFEGRSADLALFGLGKFNVTVEKGEVRIEPKLRGGAGTARGATYPEVVMALASGELTPLEAHFKGDLLARAPSGDLHLAYGYFVRFSDLALQSERLRGLLTEFQELTRVKG
jgi:hypothetical protein